MKYMGSKNRIANEIVPILEKNFEENNCEIFIDACCGGCNLIDKINPNIPRYANDINEYLIEMFKGLQSGLVYPELIDKEFYSKVRTDFNKKNGVFTKDFIGWVGFMASYNGRFFDGGYSGHNFITKNGSVRNYIKENINNINNQMQLLSNVVFSNKNLIDINPKVKSLIYFDIPYKNTKQYSCSKNFDYDVFYKKCQELKNDGHIVFVSEYEMPHNFSLVWEKEIKTSINPTKTQLVKEKLFTI